MALSQARRATFGRSRVARCGVTVRGLDFTPRSATSRHIASGRRRLCCDIVRRHVALRIATSRGDFSRVERSRRRCATTRDSRALTDARGPTRRRRLRDTTAGSRADPFGPALTARRHPFNVHTAMTMHR